MTKNIAADLHAQNLSGYELKQYLEDQIDEIEEQLNQIPTRYPSTWDEAPHTSHNNHKKHV